MTDDTKDYENRGQAPKTIAVSEVYAVCEDLEDEAEREQAKAQGEKREIAFAYQNGRRHAAKSIRRAIGAIT